MKFFTILLSSLSLAAAGSLAHADELDAALEQERLSQTATVITVIFDNSGSMAEDHKMETAQAAFGEWLKALPSEYGLSLVHFNKGEAKLALPINIDQHQQAAQVVNALSPGGKTPICQCLQVARQQIVQRRASHSPYERHVVLVFTDGTETVDRRRSSGVMSEIQELTATSVEVIGIGFHGQGDYMQPVATRYFHAKNAKELAAGLAQVDAEIDDDSDIELTAQDLKMIDRADIKIPPAPAME